VDETIFTESTLSRGEDIAAVDVAEPAVDDELALDDSWIVPVTSTLCPTCGDNFESSASTRYCMPAPAVAREGLDDELDVEVELPPGGDVRRLEDVAATDPLVAFIKR
jgi:hypothetical protein